MRRSRTTLSNATIAAKHAADEAKPTPIEQHLANRGTAARAASAHGWRRRISTTLRAMLLPLAEFSPLSGSAQWAIVSILSVALICVSLWVLLRRQPPLDAHLAKFEATIAGLTDSVNKLTEAQEAAAGHAAEIRTLKERVATLEQLRDTDAKAQREDMSTNTRQLFDRIDGVEKAVAMNFQAVERALGRLEGRIASGKG